MIREESGSYGDDDRDKEPRHEQYQVLRPVKPRCACGRAILGHVQSHSGSDTAAEIGSEVTKLGGLGRPLPGQKQIYLRLPYPARNGGLEQAFVEACDRDA